MDNAQAIATLRNIGQWAQTLLDAADALEMAQTASNQLEQLQALQAAHFDAAEQARIDAVNARAEWAQVIDDATAQRDALAEEVQALTAQRATLGANDSEAPEQPIVGG